MAYRGGHLNGGVRARPASRVARPAGAEHGGHGAAPDTALSRIAIQQKLECRAVAWMEQVNEAERGPG